MPQLRRIREAMTAIVVIAIYLSAFRMIALGPSDDVFTSWQQLVSLVLLFFVMPFHIIGAWVRLVAPGGEKDHDP